ncbi:MAG: molecular chaperone DnaJ [Pseudohongiellaceae bacterium]
MLIRLLALIALPLLAYWAVKRIARKYPLTQRQFTLLFILLVAMLALVGLIVLGRLPIHFILAPLGVAATFLFRSLPFLLRLLPLWQMVKSRVSSATGQGSHRSRSSTIRTAWFAMELDHGSGDMEGEVLQGRQSGRKVSSLSLTELLELANESAADSDSRQILEAYLDRMHPEWRQSAGGTGSARESSAEGESVMSRQLALEILGLKEPLTRDEVVQAHRKLMQKMHPDRGGSDYFAKKINSAKEFLLAQL